MVASSALAVLFTCCSLNFAQAQSGGLTGAGGTVGGTDKVEFCDLILPKVHKELQAEADATCATQFSCVQCMDRTSKMELAATLVVQPVKSDCKPVTDVKIQPDAVSRGASNVPKPAPRFRAEILQSPCFAGGTNLEVYIAGYGTCGREFSYLWEVDGRKAGHLTSIACACGKEAKVRVTHLPSGESTTLVAKLNAGCGNSDTSKD